MKSILCLLSALSALSLFADVTSLAREELTAYLGEGAAAVTTTVDPSMDAEAWSVRGENGKVFLLGGSERGLCYAAYEFLEREVGIRWLTPWGDTYVPPTANRQPRTTNFSYSGKPALEYRWFLDFGHDVGPTKGGRRFLFRQRHNIIDGETNLPCKATVYPPMCHSVHHYIPLRTYFKEHPEYFSMNKEGKRVGDIQLCFSNPGLKAELKRVFYAHIAKCGGRGIFNLSALDHPGMFCYCPECVEAEKRYGTPGAPYFLYLRELAQAMAKDYPEAVLDFLVYRVGQTEVPPNAVFGRFPDNCAAMFAPIDNDFSKTYEHPNNVAHLKNLRGWSAILRHLWTWYYPLPYGDWAPYAGVRRTAEDLKTAYEAGLTGGTFEHDVGTRIGAGFADLLTYLISRLYCNPKADWRPIADEFCQLYYGAAAGDLIAYRDELDRQSEVATSPLAWDRPLPVTADPAFLVKWNKAFDAIERKVSADPVALQRVRECRLTLTLATLRAMPKIRKAFPDAKIDPKSVLVAGLATARAAVDRRFTDAKVANQHYLKFASPAERATRQATVVPKPLPACFASLPEEDVIEILANPTCGAKSVEDPAAAIGLACVDVRDFEKPRAKYEIGFYDREHKRHFPRRAISPDEVVPDAYHFYRVGRYELTRDCLVWLSTAWRLQFELGPYWRPGGEDEWDIYVSLKLEGPFFSDRSEMKQNRVLFDRAVLVRVPKDEAVQPKDLPVGEALPALPPDPFPDRMSAYVWRNWGLVDKTRLAETVGATSADLMRIATEMGLSAEPAVDPEWATHGYVTVIRRNWNLLDYNQLLKLTGMSVAQMKSVLVDYDFLFQKFERMKPLCRPLVYRAEEIALTHGARMKIAEALAAEGIDASAPYPPCLDPVDEHAGNRLWTECLKTQKGETQTCALREARMFAAIECPFTPIVDQAEFIRARRRGNTAEMRRLAACELKTAKAMLTAVRSDARIGSECANHYFHAKQDVLEKIVNCRKLIQSLGAADVKPQNVPELMTTSDAKKVSSVSDWERVRRPELLECFTRRVFGRRPAAAERPKKISFETIRDDDYAEGKARRRIVRVHYEGPCGRGHFDLVSFVPTAAKRVPAFVLICNRGADNIDPDRKTRDGFWPVEEILSRGYATVAFTTQSVAADKNVGFSQGVFAAYQREAERDAESWATLSAWAWGASRAMDWIETVPEMDAEHVAVVGHSRGGKAALWTGATDSRFALACSNDSGCSGAKLNHIDLPESEHVVQIMKNFPYWFCGNYAQAIGKETELDFDQHELVALMAPRLVAIGSASEDHWAGQLGEWWSGKLASPAWELYGKKGLVAAVWPKTETPQQEGCVSYHLRTGEHTLAAYDWKCYMDFADRHEWRNENE